MFKKEKDQEEWNTAWDPWVHFLKKGANFVLSLFFFFCPMCAKSSVGFEVCLGWTSRPHGAASGKPPFKWGWELPSTALPGVWHVPSTSFSLPFLLSLSLSLSLSELCPTPNLAPTSQPWLAKPNGGWGNKIKGRQWSKSEEILHVGKFERIDLGFFIPPRLGKPQSYIATVWLGAKLGFPKKSFCLVFSFHFSGPITLRWISTGQLGGLLSHSCLGEPWGSEGWFMSYTGFQWGSVAQGRVEYTVGWCCNIRVEYWHGISYCHLLLWPLVPCWTWHSFRRHVGVQRYVHLGVLSWTLMDHWTVVSCWESHVMRPSSIGLAHQHHGLSQ